MQCSFCGYYVAQGQATTCPNCHRSLIISPHPATPFGGYPADTLPIYALPAKKHGPVRLIIGAILAATVIMGLASLLLVVRSVHTRIITTSSNITTKTSANGTFQDTLTSNNNGWPENQHCFIESDGYHIKDGYQCFAPVTVPNNYELHVAATVVGGPANEPWGVVFRQSGKGSLGSEYYFALDGNGDWRFRKCVVGSCSYLMSWTTNDNFLAGLNYTNTLEIRISGSNFDFIVNGLHIGQITDTSLKSGTFGFFANPGMEVVFTNLIITWSAN